MKSRKRKLVTKPEDPENVPLPAKRKSEDPVPRKAKWINKQRVLVFASRGISHRDRHLMEDIKKLMPHHKPEPKMERSKSLTIVNEMCEMKNCNKAIMFEGRKKRDLYMWLANIPNGPSVKFLVENIYTMAELKLTGNCLRGSRPLLTFDPSFNEKPHYAILKELFVQIFGVPNHHPKTQPFFDHVYTFMVLDNRVWFRNFQILSEDGALVEIGPRFVLNPVKIFSGSFGGIVLWENQQYINPAKFRQQFKVNAKDKYLNRMQQKIHAETTKPKESYKFNPLDSLFKDDPFETAKKLQTEEKSASPQNKKEKISVNASKLKKKVKHKGKKIIPNNKKKIIANNKKKVIANNKTKVIANNKKKVIANNKKKINKKTKG